MREMNIRNLERVIAGYNLHQQHNLRYLGRQLLTMYQRIANGEKQDLIEMVKKVDEFITMKNTYDTYGY